MMTNENKALLKARKMAYYAYQTVPLYMHLAKNVIDENIIFEELPYVSKEIYRQNEGLYLSQKYYKEISQDNLFQGTTSGSTGKVTNYFWDRSDEKKSLLELWYYRNKYYNIHPHDKMCYFYPVEDKSIPYVLDKNVLGLSENFITNGRLEETLQYIMNFSPKWMILQPGVAWLLCNMIKKIKNNISITSVEYIEFTGEYLDEGIRNLVQETFQCKTANQYGMREMNSIAYECPEGHMHVMSGNVYVEIVNSDVNGIGDICVTTLKNRAMPYIRYITGDKGRWKKLKCVCGNHNPIIEICNGRGTDWVKKINGEILHPYIILDVINQINNTENNCILQYQIIQKQIDYFQYNLVLDEEVDKNRIEQKICLMTAQSLQQEFDLEFRYYNEILPDKKTGKIARFYSEIGNRDQTSRKGEIL